MIVKNIAKITKLKKTKQNKTKTNKNKKKKHLSLQKCLNMIFKQF